MPSILANCQSTGEAIAFFKWTREAETSKSVSLQSNAQNQSKPEPWTKPVKRWPFVGKGRARPWPRPTLHSFRESKIENHSKDKIRSHQDTPKEEDSENTFLCRPKNAIGDLPSYTLDGIPTRTVSGP